MCEFVFIKFLAGQPAQCNTRPPLGTVSRDRLGFLGFVRKDRGLNKILFKFLRCSSYVMNVFFLVNEKKFGLECQWHVFRQLFLASYWSAGFGTFLLGELAN
jgi:hypothetical protein